MYDFFNKHGIKVFTLLGAVLTLITLFTLGFSDSREMNDFVRFGGGTNFGLMSVYIVGIACLILAITMPIMSSISNPKSLMKPLIGFGAIVIIFLLCWAIAGDEVIEKFGPDSDFDLTASGSKFVGGMVISVYVLTIGAVVLIIGSEVRNIFK